MNITELRTIEKEFAAGQEYPEGSTAKAEIRTQHSFVAPEWKAGLPELRAYALLRSDITTSQYQDLLLRYWRILERLYEALHSNWLQTELTWMQPRKGEKPSCFWYHQNFDLLRIRDRTRGIDVDKGDLLRFAAWYLTQPELRTNRLDWLFLDAIIFTELEAHGEHVFIRRADTETNWAAIWASGSEGKYVLLVPVAWLLRIALKFAAWPTLAYVLFVGGHETWAYVTLGLWILYLVLSLVTYPSRWQTRRKATKLLKHLGDLYGMLGEKTISPRKLKEKLDAAAADGVVLDGALFSIVDRMLARDPTAFIPNVG